MSLVSIIIAHHDIKNKAYLEMCLESVSRQDVDDKEVIVVDSSEVKKDYPDWVKPIYVPHTTNSAVAYNLAEKATDQSSKYLLMLNDDVVMTKGALAELIDSMKDNPVIMNAFSNCDTEIYYWADMKLHKDNDDWLQLPRQFDLEFVKGYEEDMFSLRRTQRIIMPVPFVCFYATIMQHKLWQDLGGLDEQFASGPDDRDFCERAALQKTISVINFGTTIWHFGGRTIAIKDPNEVAKNREVNADKYLKKWGRPQ